MANHIFLEFVKKCFSGIKMKMFFFVKIKGEGGVRAILTFVKIFLVFF